MKIRGQTFTIADVINMVDFLHRFVGSYYEHGCRDIDGEDIQHWMEKCEFVKEGIATAEEAEEDWCLDWDIEEGDLIYRNTALTKKIMAQGNK